LYLEIRLTLSWTLVAMLKVQKKLGSRPAAGKTKVPGKFSVLANEPQSCPIVPPPEPNLQHVSRFRYFADDIISVVP
jgi:hypothetical protein